MKYKLSKKQLDDAMEYLKNRAFDDYVFDKYFHIGESLEFQTKDMEPIIELLPKPSIKSVEDLQALEGWELSYKGYQYHNIQDIEDINYDTVLTPDISRVCTIRQISLPLNSFLLSDCIEEADEVIEVGDIFLFAPNENGIYLLAEGKHGPDVVVGDSHYHGDYCKLIRKAKDITIQDRVDYLGEKWEDYVTPTDGHMDAPEMSEIEKLREWVKVWVKSELEKRGEDK